MIFHEHPSEAARAAVRDARRSVYWLDTDDRPAAAAPVTGLSDTDLLVIGGGFSGLWTALMARQADPNRRVTLLEGACVAEGATGRNGGFVASSLTHGLMNGLERWPEEMPTLLEMGRENLQEIEKAVSEWDIDCGWSRAGEIDMAIETYQVDDLRDYATAGQALGEDLHVLDGEAAQSAIHSPTYLGGVVDRSGVALVDPARLAWGLRSACIAMGVELHENSPVLSLEDEGDRLLASTPAGAVRASHVALATNAYPPLLKRLSHFVVPVYDYVLVTEPLTDQQWTAIGWEGREGVSDAGNQFHYYRVTPDGRILWGGYDAVYHPGNGFGAQYEHHDESYERLAEHFLQTFPQLAGIRFSHAWGGAIDTCSRFSAFWGTAYSGKLAYVAGYTGLGVGASRFGAATMLDLLDGLTTQRTELEMVQSKPLPFPPEPIRSWGIGLTTSALHQADLNEGRRNLWLRTLDRLGLGFDS